MQVQEGQQNSKGEQGERTIEAILSSFRCLPEIAKDSEAVLVPQNALNSSESHLAITRMIA